MTKQLRSRDNFPISYNTIFIIRLTFTSGLRILTNHCIIFRFIKPSSVIGKWSSELSIVIISYFSTSRIGRIMLKLRRIILSDCHLLIWNSYTIYIWVRIFSINNSIADSWFLLSCSFSCLSKTFVFWMWSVKDSPINTVVWYIFTSTCATRTIISAANHFILNYSWIIKWVYNIIFKYIKFMNSMLFNKFIITIYRSVRTPVCIHSWKTWKKEKKEND